MASRPRPQRSDVTRRQTWFRKVIDVLPSVILFVLVTQLIAFATWVVHLEARMRVLETVVNRQEERIGRIVQAMDAIYDKLNEHMRHQIPSTPPLKPEPGQEKGWPPF